MNHEDPNHGPAHSPPVVLQPIPPSHLAVTPPPLPPSHPMVMPATVHGQPPPPTTPAECPPGSSRPKPSVPLLEIPPLVSMSPGSQFMTFSPTSQRQPLPSSGRSRAETVPPSPSSQPHTRVRPRSFLQPLEIPPNPGYQPEVMSPVLRVTSPALQVAAMSPKLSPTSQRQSISSTSHRQSITMSPTSHHQAFMMGSPQPIFPHCQPYMYPPPPYYHPGPPFNVTMAPAGGFQAPNHCYPEHERTWSTDLFECTKDIRNCTRTICCPCVTFGQIAEIVNEGTTPWYEPGLLCALISAFSPCFCIFHPSFPYTAFYRTKLRNKYKLKGSVLEDCLVHSFCECCALCQEFRELDHQGFDVPLGWHENKRRERQAVAVFRFIPPEEQGMTR